MRQNITGSLQPKSTCGTWAQAMLGIKDKYGKNAILKASSFEEGATMRQRNGQIGGHSAGVPDG